MSLRRPAASLPTHDLGPASAGERTVPVVAAVIRRETRLLVGRRPLHKRHGGLWEFPGGKLLVGEDLAAAAARELREELGLELCGVGAILFDAADPGSPFLIRFLEVEVEGSPVPREHDAVGWFTPAELGRLPLAPSDARFVRERLALG
jgi:8-oxo-dGTP pyrophosphatase MutT (NUDIX family)